MPFTLAHPAAVLPLCRVPGLVPSALVVGAMSPDLEYFLALRPIATVGHDLLGVPLFCVPAGLVTWWLWHRLWRWPWAELLPDSLRARLLGGADLPRLSPRLVALAALSIALGAWTHIAWDAATHAHGWLVVRSPVLTAHALRVGDQAVPLYRVLQHGSSVVGLAILAIWLRGAPRAIVARTMSPGQRRVVVLALAAVATVAASVRWCGPGGTAARLVLAVIAAMAAAVAAGTVFAALWHGRRRRAVETDGVSAGS